MTITEFTLKADLPARATDALKEHYNPDADLSVLEDELVNGPQGFTRHPNIGPATLLATKEEYDRLQKEDQTDNAWRSTAKELPTNDQNCLIYNGSVSVGFYKDGDQLWHDYKKRDPHTGALLPVTVKYWRPLPKAPRN